MTLPNRTAVLQPLKIAGGRYLSNAVGLSTINPSFGPRANAVRIDWSEYGAGPGTAVAIDVDLASGNPQQPLDVIRSIFIDNSFSFTPVYVIFPDTQFTAICPANSVACIPVLTNQAVKAIVYADEFSPLVPPPTVTIHFTNINQAGWVIGTGEFEPPVPVPSMVFLGQFPGTSPITTTKSFLNTSLSLADPTRAILVVPHATLNQTGVLSSTVTIGGNPMTVLRNQSGNLGGTRIGYTGMHILLVPAGTAADIVVTYNQAVSQNLIDVYALYNLNSLVPVDIDGTTNTGGTGVSIATLNTLDNGVAIAGMSGGDGGSNIVPFSNSGGIVATGNQNVFGAYGFDYTVGAPLSITGSISPTTNYPPTLVAASFR